MRFRPCIDIHNGKVKQIVGGTLCDRGDSAAENFVSGLSAADYARMYARDGLRGGHVILLNGASSPCYEATKEQALSALRAAPGFLQAGGGITPENAADFLDAGASHVIVTSYVFREGRIDLDALDRLVRAVGKDRLVLDMSARRRRSGARLYVVTDRWQTFTEEVFSLPLLRQLRSSCAEFLVHGVDVEGKQGGPDGELLLVLGQFAAEEQGREKTRHGLPAENTITYAGGIRSMEDVGLVRAAGGGLVDLTVGSALDLFGGRLPYEELMNCIDDQSGDGSVIGEKTNRGTVHDRGK